MADIVVRLPPNLQSLTFELEILNDGPYAIEQSMKSVPWRQIDRQLEARQSMAVVEVKAWSVHRGLGDAIDIVRDIVSNRMTYTLRNERLRLQ